MVDAPRKAGSRERVRTYLEAHGLADGLFEFEQSTKTAQEAADAMGCELGQIVKSLVFVVDGKPVVALVAGDRRGDTDAIAALLGGGKARFADA
jgi:prolyl-tRNA editing enzyme YbaK/EbsC (Cys-tRNA(Pro) deacylase)